MSDLQVGLLGVGILVVLAVIAYNKLQEFKYRRRAEQGFSARSEDPLLDTGPVKTPPQDPPRTGERIEPTLARESVGAEDEPEAALVTLDEKTNFVVLIESSDGAPGQSVIENSARTLAGFKKPVTVEGYNEKDARWEPLRPDVSYCLLRAGLQLVDRRGPAVADDLTLFGAAVQETAAAAGAVATVPDRDEALARAADLDRFCGEVDVQIALNVVRAGALFPGTKIRAIAEAGGLALEQDGRFRRRDRDERILYELADLDGVQFRGDSLRTLSTSGVTLELDVPRAPGGVRTFEQMRDLALQLAQALNGRIVDDRRADISPEALDRIHGQVQAVYRAMEAGGIEPGGAAALRLFS